MNRQVLKYLAAAIFAVMMLTGCEGEIILDPEEEIILKPCELNGTGTLKLINKTELRFTIKIDGVNYGQLERHDVKRYEVMEGENYVCVELSNAMCYKDFTIDIIPCEVTTK